jgi:hypothetical protein
MEIKQRIADKATSARFLSTNAVVITYCIIIMMCMYFMGKRQIPWESFMIIFTPFALLAQQIVKDYFTRNDRNGSSVEVKNV